MIGGIGVPVSLWEASCFIRSSEDCFGDLGLELVEDVEPAASVLGPQGLGLLLVHLQILSEDRLLRQDPSQTPTPPGLDGVAGVLAHGRQGLGSVDGPSRCRGGDWLDV